MNMLLTSFNINGQSHKGHKKEAYYWALINKLINFCMLNFHIIMATFTSLCVSWNNLISLSGTKKGNNSDLRNCSAFHMF